MENNATNFFSIQKSELQTAVDTYPTMVLLVDDQAIVGEMVRRALADQADLAFHFCSNAQAAMSLAEQINPMVILQDLLMPGIDGLALLQKYKVNPATQNIPVIVLSSKEDASVKSEAFKLGASDYLVKLPDPIELVARIRHHSKAYLNQIQRDQAFLALRESQQQLVAMNTELQRLINIDGLTGICNRRFVDEYLLKEWRRAMRDKTPLSVLMIDVDHFKRYNDHYGHLAGDEVLKRVALVIKQGAERPADLAGRFGGEEFVVILPNTEAFGAQHVAENIRRSLGELEIPHLDSATAQVVTLSIGGASIIPHHNGTMEDLISQADSALYEAKKLGRNRVCFMPDGTQSLSCP